MCEILSAMILGYLFVVLIAVFIRPILWLLAICGLGGFYYAMTILVPPLLR